MAALALYRIAKSLNSDKPGSVFPPWTIALIYLFNPLVLLGTLSRSTNIFSNTLVLLAIAAALNKKAAQSMILLGLATTLTLYPLYLAPALVLLAHQAQRQGTLFNQSIRLAALLFTSFALFVYLGYITSGGSWEFLKSSYGIVLFYTDLTPNIGVWWYFFGEMFEFFRPFFTCVFHIYSMIFSLPITVRFHKEPLFAIATIVGITTTFKAYPEVGDVGFYFSLLALFRPMFKRKYWTKNKKKTTRMIYSYTNRNVIDLKYPIPVLLVMLYSLALAPTFYHLWINLGSGNSNFFYAITLVYALGMIIALADTIWVALRLEYDGGKNPRLSQI